MKLNCLIIDDEPLARKGLAEYISEVDFLSLAGSFESPVKAAALLDTLQAPLLFLDIQMPKITGLQFLKTLREPPPVILTTAYPQYALEGFDLDALDYLVKPISFERFLKAVNRAKEYYALRQKEAAPQQDRAADHFFIKVGDKLVKIDLDAVLYVEALQNYVNIHTQDGKFITYLTFHAVEDYLPKDRFIKTHKSYIISARRVSSIAGNEVRIGDHHIPISRNLKDEVMEKLLSNRFLKR